MLQADAGGFARERRRCCKAVLRGGGGVATTRGSVGAAGAAASGVRRCCKEEVALLPSAGGWVGAVRAAASGVRRCWESSPVELQGGRGAALLSEGGAAAVTHGWRCAHRQPALLQRDRDLSGRDGERWIAAEFALVDGDSWSSRLDVGLVMGTNPHQTQIGPCGSQLAPRTNPPHSSVCLIQTIPNRVQVAPESHQTARSLQVGIQSQTMGANGRRGAASRCFHSLPVLLYSDTLIQSHTVEVIHVQTIQGGRGET